MQTQKQNLINFSENLKPTMLKIKVATDNYNYRKEANLSYEEQYSILQFYLEVINYLSKE